MCSADMDLEGLEYVKQSLGESIHRKSALSFIPSGGF